MTTYEKLGQYAATELPINPTNVVITAVASTSADLEWTNNYSTSGSIILQLWQTNYWLTKNEIDISSTSGTISDLPAGEEWRIRVAVLLNGVIYAAAPVVNSLPPVPYPTNLADAGSDNNFVETITWDGNDASWQAIYIRAYVANYDTCTDGEWQTIATLTDSGATSYGVSGYTWANSRMFSVGVKINDEDKFQDETVQLELARIRNFGEYNKLFLGGDVLNNGGTWVNWSTSNDMVRELNSIYNSANDYFYNTMPPPVCGGGGGRVTLANYAGTFKIRTTKDLTDNRPQSYELTPADFGTLTGVENSSGAFKLNCGESSTDAYNIEINMRGSRSITVTKNEL